LTLEYIVNSAKQAAIQTANTSKIIIWMNLALGMIAKPRIETMAMR
jgi:hypothetical protein